MQKGKRRRSPTPKNIERRKRQLFIKAKPKKSTIKDDTTSEEDCLSDTSRPIKADSESDISLDELVQRNQLQLNEAKEDEELIQQFYQTIEINEGKWVLFAFHTKTTIKHYVGKITTITNGIPTAKILRRVKSSSMFVWPQEDDFSEVQTEDIVVVLTTPTEQKRGRYTFSVSFDGINVG